MLVQDSLCSIHTFWSNDQNILKSQNPEGGGCSFHRSLHLQPDQPAAAESGCRLGCVKFDSIGSLSCLPGRLMKVSWCIPESTRDSTVQLLLCGGDCIFIRTDFKLWLTFTSCSSKYLSQPKDVFTATGFRVPVSAPPAALLLLFWGFGQCVSRVHSTNRKAFEGFGFNNTFF